MTLNSTARGERQPSPRVKAADRLTHPAVFMAALAFGAFLLYLRTAAPSVLPGDSGEFQFAAWGFWLAHPTGYPLYLILGGVWQHLLPFGNPAFRLNLFSGFWSALAVSLTFPVMLRVSGNRGAALIASLTFGVSSLFWFQATVAEVYALNTFFVVGLTLLALQWRADRRFASLAGFAFVFGLALTHHRSIILLIPAFAAFFSDALVDSLRQDDWGRIARRALLLAALAALPLLLYLYIPLRASATPYATLQVSSSNRIVAFENNPRGWLGLVAGERFENELALDARSLAALGALPAQLLGEFNPFGVALGLGGGGVLLVRRQFNLAAFLLFGSIAIVGFSAAYHIGDIRDYYTPAYMFFAMATSAGAGAILTSVNQHRHFQNSTIPAVALLALLALVPLENLTATFVDHDRSLKYETRTLWETVLASNLPRGAILVSNDRDELTPLWYLQLVERVRPDLLGLFPRIAPGARYANIVTLVDSIIKSGRPVFTIKSLPVLNLRYRFQDWNNGLERVVAAPLPPPQYESNVAVGQDLAVVGYSILRGTAAVGETITVGVQWHPLQRLEHDYTTSLQLFDARGEKVGQGDDHVVGAPDYPMTDWRVGQIIEDRFELQLGSNLQPGDYRLDVRVYDPETGTEEGELTPIGTLTLEE